MEPSENALQAMDRLPVSKAVFKNILPSIGIFLMMLIYNYADLFFIGLTHNDYMVSAITLASPIFMFFMAFGSLFGTGGLTLISQDTAKGETGRIKKISSFCFWCSIAIGVLSLLLILLFATPLAKLLGANGVMGHFGDLEVAAMGVGMKISVIGSVISNGVGQGIQPLIGYQVGNGNKKRFKETLRFSMIFSVAVSLVISVLCFAGAKAIVSVFLTETVSIELGVAFTRIILSTMWISGMINLLSFTIQSMGTSRQATLTSLARNGYVDILAVLLMSAFGSVYAVAAAQPIADVISFVIAVIMLRSSMKKCFPNECITVKTE